MFPGIRRKFGRKRAHRDHMIRNLVTSLVLYERIVTTVPRAKEAQRFIDRAMRIARGNALQATRALNGFFFDRNATKKVIGELSARFKGRVSGFTRVIKMRPRPGDNAPVALLEFVVMATPAKEGSASDRLPSRDGSDTPKIAPIAPEVKQSKPSSPKPTPKKKIKKAPAKKNGARGKKNAK